MADVTEHRAWPMLFRSRQHCTFPAICGRIAVRKIRICGGKYEVPLRFLIQRQDCVHGHLFHCRNRNEGRNTVWSSACAFHFITRYFVKLGANFTLKSGDLVGHCLVTSKRFLPAQRSTDVSDFVVVCLATDSVSELVSL